MEKILILGINSFSGSTFAKFIQNKKYKLFGVYHTNKNKKYILYDKKKINLIKINNLEIKKIVDHINKIKPSIIIDFASICMVNESWKFSNHYKNVNYFSKLKMIKYLKQKDFLKKYIYISTPEVFGSKKKIYEDDRIFKPTTPYAKSKMMAEKMFMDNFKKYNFPTIICRFSNFYGPGQPLYRLIPKLCIALDLDIKFPMQGTGSSKRNFIYAKDFSSGILSVIKRGKTGKTYHFSGNQILSIKNVIKKICQIKNKRFENYVISTKDRKNKDNIYYLQSKMTRKELKWEPKTSILLGLKNTATFYKNNLKYFKNKKIKMEFKFEK